MNTNTNPDKPLWGDCAVVAPLVVALLASVAAGLKIISAGSVTAESAAWARIGCAVAALAACVTGGAALWSRRKGDRNAMVRRLAGAGLAIGISLFAVAGATGLVKLSGFMDEHGAAPRAERGN